MTSPPPPNPRSSERVPKSQTIPTLHSLSDPEMMKPLWSKAFLIHSPIIGLGFGLIAGLCFVAGMSLSVILDPDANNPDPPIDSSPMPGASGTQSNAAEDLTGVPFASPPPLDSATPQTIVTPNGVLIVVPADRSFAQNSSSGSQDNLAPSDAPTASQQDNRRIGVQNSSVLILWGIGGICLGGAGISAWFSRYRNHPETIAIGEEHPGALALRSTPESSLVHTGIQALPFTPYRSLPQVHPNEVPALEGLLTTIENLPYAHLDPSAGQIVPLHPRHPADLLESTEGDESTDLPVSDSSIPDLATLMDIRKRRPWGD